MPGVVYVLTNRPNGTLYVGVTRNLARRVQQHREGDVAGFTKTHDLRRLVYFEPFEDLFDAVVREKRLKAWKRAWKVRLIEEANPLWRDLSESF